MSSKKPGKQRKAQFNAPIHVKRKRIRARLRTEDPDLAGVRTITVRAVSYTHLTLPTPPYV